MNGKMISESWVEFPRKQTLRQSYCAGCLLRHALEIGTCRKKGKEAGLAERKSSHNANPTKVLANTLENSEARTDRQSCPDGPRCLDL